MNNKSFSFLGILFAVIAATGFVSCSDDATSNFDPASTIAEIFENMKGEYSGTYNTPYNVRKEVKFSIDKQAEFKISNFPMENILYSVYQGEYENVKLNADALAFSAPIDSVGYDSGFLTFITKSNTIVNRIDFSFTKDEQTHNGWALVTVKGMFNNTLKMMDANFIVTDLVIDNKDFTSSSCPIDNIVEAKHQ